MISRKLPVCLLVVGLLFGRCAFAEPTLTQLLDACKYLGPGDIPTDTFRPPANAVYVAAPANGGNDSNNGSINAPFAHLDKAIEYANAHPATPLTIYLRGGIHKFKGPPFDPYQAITRGNLYVTAYRNELVIIQPYFYPNNPTDSGNERVFEFNGPYQNITFDRLNFEGWSVIFNPGAPLATAPMRNLTIKNITASQFKRRNGDPTFGVAFFETGYLDDDVYGPGKVIFDHPERAKYQIDGLILSNISVQGVDLAINVGDENDANVKSMRVSHFGVVNPSRQPGDSANDAFAVVNSWKVLIDQSRIVNINDDGIDLKSFDTAVVNCHIEGAGRNAVKFWRNGELINSILFNVTDIDDGAIVVKDGPFRMVNSVLLGHRVGYAGVMAYDSPSTCSLEIVNSVFGECKGFYVGTHDFTAKNNRYFNILDGAALVEGAVNAATATQLNLLPNCSGNAMSTNQFANPAGGDFSLKPVSSWINAGTRQGVLLPVFDFLGNPRIFGNQVDIGPIEFSRTPATDWNSYR
jgi:hypothetical protein